MRILTFLKWFRSNIYFELEIQKWRVRSLNGICYYSFLLLFRFGNRKAVEISHLLLPPHSLHFQKGNGLWPSLNQTLPYNRARYATNIESSPAIFHLHRLSIQINNSFNPHLDMFTANLLTSKSFFVLFLVLYHSFIHSILVSFFLLSFYSLSCKRSTNHNYPVRRGSIFCEPNESILTRVELLLGISILSIVGSTIGIIRN